MACAKRGYTKKSALRATKRKEVRGEVLPLAQWRHDMAGRDRVSFIFYDTFLVNGNDAAVASTTLAFTAGAPLRLAWLCASHCLRDVTRPRMGPRANSRLHCNGRLRCNGLLRRNGRLRDEWIRWRFGARLAIVYASSGWTSCFNDLTLSRCRNWYVSRLAFHVCQYFVTMLRQRATWRTRSRRA